MKAASCNRTLAASGAGLRARIGAAAAGVLGFAWLTALGARIAVPLPGTPVPMTLQTLFVLLAGLSLGPWLGSASMLCYLLLGVAGCQVFALGSSGPGTVFGVTGGYLIGFALAQPVIGLTSASGRRRWRRALLAVLLGNGVIFACGLSWLALWTRAGLWETLRLGLLPFLPGLCLKTALAAAIGGTLAPVVRRRLSGR